MQTSTSFTLLLYNLPIRVRLALTRLMQSQPGLQVLSANAGTEELAVVVRRLRPNLLIVGDDQLSALESLARQCPVPVLLYTSTSLLQGVLRQTARWGVLNAIGSLPTTEAALILWQAEALRKISSSLPPTSLPRVARQANELRTLALPRGIVIIGASTGGVKAVEQLVSGLAPALGWAVVVAVHLPAHFTRAFVERLQRASLLPVEAATEGSMLQAGKITVVPGERNMTVRAGFAGAWPIWQIASTQEPSPCFDTPSIDLLMGSAVQVAGAQVIGAVLTGLGHDGTLGARAIQQRGGVVVAQDKDTCAVFSMPGSVIKAGYASAVVPLPSLAAYLNNATALVRASRYVRASSPAQPVYR